MGKKGSTPSFTAVYAAAAVSLAYIFLVLLGPGREGPLGNERREAVRLMRRAEEVLPACREAKGLPVDPKTDPNRTGLIGVESSIMTTSLGSLEAKRTTTNPEFAALLVRLLGRAGVRRGDVIAVGASSSFPALILATLAAARAMGVEPLVISSLGASEWGANVPGFTWLDMADCLRRAGLFAAGPVALAIGGEEDVGRGLDPEALGLLRAAIAASGLPLIDEPDLRANVARRLALYDRAAAGRPIKAFVNIGGSWANIGTNAEVLKLRPGLLDDVFVPPPAERGVLQAMAVRKVPVIHLLNVKGLAERYGLPWDPRPFPLS